MNKKRCPLFITLAVWLCGFGALNAQITAMTEDASCSGKADGKITVMVGISGTYQYALDGGGFQASNVFNNVKDGDHTVKVKDTDTKCEFSKTVTVMAKSKMVVSINGGGSFTVVCSSNNSVTLTASVSGGTPDYIYSWPNGQLIVSSTGLYTVNVTDSKGCTAKAGAFVVFIPIVCSRDPNDMIGPAGFGESKWVSVKDNLPYTIRFENDPEFATAPAQKVVIEHVLDEDLNLFSVRLGDFGFGNMVFQVPANSTFYTARLDVRDSLGIFVDVTAAIDVTASKVFWIFESIDPATGLPPSDPLQGLLPVNDTLLHNGEGFVNFTVKPKSSAITGDSILAKAAIVFDINETINTPQIFNLIDALPPNSFLTDSLPEITDSTSFLVSWQANDDPGGCGVRDYTLYVSENNGPFTAYESGILDTFTTFIGQPGNTYSFFTRATDYVGNIEPLKMQGDDTIMIRDVRSLNLFALGQNEFCAGDSLAVQWSSTGLSAINIFFSPDGGMTNQQIGTNVDANSSLFKWQIPTTFLGCIVCLVRITDTLTTTGLRDSASTIIHTLPMISAGSNITICKGNTTQLAASGGISYVWSPAFDLTDSEIANPYTTPEQTVTYYVVGKNAIGCANSDSTIVTVIQPDTTVFNIFTCIPTSVGTTIDTLTNSAGCDSLIFLITLPDTIPPNVACQNALTLPLNSFGQATLGVAQINNGSSDNCSVSFLLSQTNFNCSDLGANTITLTVSDPFNNIATCQSIVTVIDPNFPPACNLSDTLFLYSYTGPDTISAGGANCTGILNWGTGTPTVTSNIGANIVSFNFDAALTGYNIGDVVPANTVVVVAYIALDDQMHRDTFYFPIAFKDITPPSAVCRNVSVNLSATGTASITSMHVNNGSTDACGIDTLVLSSEIFTCINAGANVITLTVTDINQNTSTCTSIVTVIDARAPVLTCPAAITANTAPNTCTAIVNYTPPVGTDNCPGASTAQSDNTGLSSGSPFPKGATTLAYTVTDAAGLSATCQFTITIVDAQAPAIACPANITTNTAPNACTAVVNYTPPVGTDNCPGTNTAQSDNTGLSSGSAFPKGATTLAYTVTDAAGLSATCQFGVTIIDAQAPAITCPANITANTALNTCAATVTYTPPVGTDNCPGAITAQSDNTGLSSGSAFPKGVTTLAYTVTDAVGLSASCQFSITVVDAQAPAITCPTNITANTALNTCAATVNYTAPVGTDNCPAASTAQSDNTGLGSGSAFPKGATTLAYTVTDAAGLSATCQFTITIVDAQAPSIACPANITNNTAPNACTAVVNYTAPVGTDNCPGANTAQSDNTGLSSGSAFPKGVTALAYTVTDVAGLSTTCQFAVTVVDAQAPSIACPANITTNTAPNACTTVVNYTAPVGTDNCPGTNTAQSDNTGLSSGSAFPKGVTTLAYTVTDAVGLTARCTFTVTIIDNQIPAARCVVVAPLTLTALGNGSASPTIIDNGSTDNCEIASLAVSPNQFSCANVGPVTVTLVATDGSGNSNQCTSRLDVLASAACTPPGIANAGGPNIADPCTCLGNGRFAEEVVIGPANSGQAWFVQNTTLINPQTNLAYAPNTPFVEIPLGGGQSRYVLQGVHLDGVGYTLSAASPYWPTVTLSIGNTCSYPKPVLALSDGPFCLNSPTVTLTGDPGDASATQSFTINGAAASVFNPSLLGIGNHTVVYTVDGGRPKANGPNDPGCISSVSKIVSVIATPSNMVCNDNVQLSLDEDCRVVVAPDMVLEGTYGCYDDYIVAILGAGGQPLGNTLTGSNIGQILRFTVRHLPSGNTCWGQIRVEDKLPPVLGCKPVWAVCAAANYDPNYLRNVLGLVDAQPNATDNCNLRSLNFVDNPLVDLDCNAAPINNLEVSAYFSRKWTAADASGNVSTCEQLIYLERRHIWDVQFPEDVEADCKNTPNVGVPYILFNGVRLPLQNSCDLNAIASDQLVPVCDGTRKILRTWTVYDGCLPTGSGTSPVAYDNPRKQIQVIKYVDNQGPVAQCPPAVVISDTDPLKCCASVDLPDVLVQDNCSRLKSIQAAITVRDPLNNNTVLRTEQLNGSIGDFPGNNWWEPDTMAYVGASSCLPIGRHDVRYTLVDDCGNQSFCDFTLSVQDLTPPIMACDEFTVGVVDGDDPNDCYLPDNSGCNMAGVGYIKAKTFDDGSYDNCNGALKFTVRRMPDANGRYSNFVEGLNKTDGIPPCNDNSGRPTEFERATLEWDSLKLYCNEVGSTQTVIVRAYQLQADGSIALDPGSDPSPDDDRPIFGECMVQIEVQDKVRPTCAPPASVTVSCENFDPTLWAYGHATASDNCCLDESRVYQGKCGLSHTANYNQFDTACNKGTILRTFRVFDCHGNSVQCTQRVVVTYSEDYYVRFPDDRIVTVCDGSGVYGAPTFFGEDCELLATSFDDDTFTVVQDACYKIERTWKVINWCTYDPNCGLTHVPNPTPNATVNNPANFPGPIVSDINGCDPTTINNPWRSACVKINPTDAANTGYTRFFQLPSACSPSGSKFNGYTYTQIIKISDGNDPVPQCVKPDTCDLTDNDPNFWNVDYWWDATHASHDLCEMPIDLKLTATDACSGANLNFRYLLFLDLDNNGSMETVVSSSNLPGVNTIHYNNASNPNYTGGTPRAFDHRAAPLIQNPSLDWYRFAIQVTRSGNNATAAVRFNTMRQPNNFVLPLLPHGKHKIKWVIEDGCGNETVCEYPFEIKDCKAPTVVCKPLSVNIMPTGMITLWASDFLEYMFDNCTPASMLTLGVSTEASTTGVFPRDANGNPITNVTFDCTQIGAQIIHLWAEDTDGNGDFCAIALLVQDNAGHCGPKATVAGQLATEEKNGVEEGNVHLSGSHPALPPVELFDLSDNSGQYRFSNAIPLLGNYTVTPTKTDNALNGVSTLDLALISKHILGIEPLNSPYKIIAADANKSGTVTTFDVVELRKLILGIYDELPSAAAWRFVDKAYVFPDPTAPFSTPFPESKTISSILTNQLDDNFVGVKIGDVNGSAIANELMSIDDRSKGNLYFEVEDRNIRPEEVIEVDFVADTVVEGYQFTLKYENLEILEILPGTGMGLEHFAVFQNINTLTTSFNGSVKGRFKIKFKARRAGLLSQMIGISSSITKAEAYEGKGFPAKNVVLRFKNNAGDITVQMGFELYQNRPNPFMEKTLIGFHLPESTKAILTIFDETGRVMHRQEGDFAKGYNHFAVHERHIKSKGVFYYKVETAQNAATRKMVVVK